MPANSVAAVSLPKLPTKDRPKGKQALRVKGKLFNAIELIVFEGLPLDEAATKTGLTTYTIRQAFGRAHVIAHMKARREVLRASACGSNILRLEQIKRAADNMPAIQAIRTLEQMGDDVIGGAAAVSHSPGITIRIINAVQSGHADAHQPVMDVIEATRTIPVDSD